MEKLEKLKNELLTMLEKQNASKEHSMYQKNWLGEQLWKGKVV